MSDIGDAFKALRELQRGARAKLRHQAQDRLKEEGIPFTTNNDGIHLIVEGPTCFIDYWPGTGRWKSRKGYHGFGLVKLINYIKRGQ